VYQGKYAKDVLKNLDMDEVKPVLMPMSTNVRKMDPGPFGSIGFGV
jgi:hypothetical protein